MRQLRVILGLFTVLGLQSGTATAADPRPPLHLPDSEATQPQEMKDYSQFLRDTSVQFSMTRISGGTFIMGSQDGDQETEERFEAPQHSVQLEPFWIGSHEVTWDEYNVFRLREDRQVRQLSQIEGDAADLAADVLPHPEREYSDPTAGEPSAGRPAYRLTRFAAKSYCVWLSAKTGHFYRVPTEAEWEYACRAGTETPYFWGIEPDQAGDYAWIQDNKKNAGPHPVGKKKPNPWGLYDMVGNVGEWCLDAYDKNYYATLKAEPTGFPLRLADADHKLFVIRGGSIESDAPEWRSAARGHLTTELEWTDRDPQFPKSRWWYPSQSEAWVGLRVVRPLRRPTAEEAIRYHFAPDPETDN